MHDSSHQSGGSFYLRSSMKCPKEADSKPPVSGLIGLWRKHYGNKHIYTLSGLVVLA